MTRDNLRYPDDIAKTRPHLPISTQSLFTESAFIMPKECSKAGTFHPHQDYELMGFEDTMNFLKGHT